jgi:uncharacterized protein (TIGR02266 family)
VVNEVTEKRKNPRIMVRVLVDFESDNTYFYDYSNNLSEGGIFVETDKLLPVGTSLTLRFTLPSVDRVFQAIGRVAWLYDPKAGDEGPPRQVLGRGMGVEFKNLDATDLELIQRYVSSQTNPSTGS